MRLAWLAALVMFACGSTSPPSRSPAQRAADATAAVSALRAGQFDVAAREAETALALDPGNAQAAAVHAIATYQRTGNRLATEIFALLETSKVLKGFEHERGRHMWIDFGVALERVDRDLAVVAADPAFALELCPACWEHDWNRNGQIDESDRRLFEIEVDAAGERLADGDPRRRPTFRFDVGDAEWARAMVAFQRAIAELVLAYRWNELDKLYRSSTEDDKVVLHLADAARVRHARELVLAGVGFAARARAAYLAETDDDREWLPNPRQHSHPIPLAVDDALYARWRDVTDDIHRLLASEDGLALVELAAILAPRHARDMPDAYLDVGAMLREP